MRGTIGLYLMKGGVRREGGRSERGVKGTIVSYLMKWGVRMEGGRSERGVRGE